ncbi:aldo/keto reductase [Bacillus canaveralius]|uniref:Aldo/keto reductase n=1 Tax=Bacillus canaveralius TaxID=1403243 RepID=A0A2N5GFZ2_9BACI|nr:MULTISPECIES: aldo/keto reductase [Bacillus]PLR79653.1 aldo/keto reductase [Bacillus canaveralius]PLR80859.1 aldo/keto reductase [Bacillus sp. V33-4]PLS00844.1 aldo/keto reductase [Bacillus canaveralius]RSK53808.1 aldo/keto reductase [Bacillus canaveralius]
MLTSMHDTVSLNNGLKMPIFGLGVYKVEEGNQTFDTVKTALELGYRLIDTAAFYENEAGVGQAIKESGIPRQDIFVTTKVWNDQQGYDSTLKAFENSLEKLGLEYVNLYLIHWPVKGKYLETWRALEKIYREGKAKAIGVSNFNIDHLRDILENGTEVPAVNQIELHPLLSQQELRAFCQEKNIKVEAWSPIARGRVLEEPVLNQIAEKHGKSPAQVILRWHLQNGVIVIPKSVNPARLQENADIFDFELSNEDIEKINSLNKNERFGADPDNFDF